jgi:hypothetical protein
MERVMRIELTTSAWKAEVLPLNYTRIYMAVPTGIEPAISCVTGRHVNRYTTGPLICITEPFKKMAEEEGFEPPHGLTRLSVFKTDPFSRTWVFLRNLVEPSGIEPLTSCVQGRRSPS